MQTTDQPSAIVICVSRNLLFLSRPTMPHRFLRNMVCATRTQTLRPYAALLGLQLQAWCSNRKQGKPQMVCIQYVHTSPQSQPPAIAGSIAPESICQARERESLSRAQTLRSCAKLRAWCSTSDSNSFAVKVSNTSPTAGSINHHPIQATYSRSTT